MNVILATALADDHRRDLQLDAEDRRLIRLSRSPIARPVKARRLSFGALRRSGHGIGYRDWLTAGRL